MVSQYIHVFTKLRSIATLGDIFISIHDTPIQYIQNFVPDLQLAVNFMSIQDDLS